MPELSGKQPRGSGISRERSFSAPRRVLYNLVKI